LQGFRILLYTVAFLVLSPTAGLKLPKRGSDFLTNVEVPDNAIPHARSSFLRYGSYCGPGPDDSLWDFVQPIDFIDQTCQLHDRAYKTCLEGLSRDAGVKMPKILHQIMPVRGFAPSPLIKAVFALAPKYMSCMHEADINMVKEFVRLEKENSFPTWWSQPEETPQIMKASTTGYQEACAFGANGVCVLTLRKMFTIMLGMFRNSVERDIQAAPHVLSEYRGLHLQLLAYP
jgi:hypothetical protein